MNGFFSLSKFYLNFIKVCEIFDKQFQCSLFIALAEGVSSYLENLQTCKQFADLFGLFLFLDFVFSIAQHSKDSRKSRRLSSLLLAFCFSSCCFCRSLRFVCLFVSLLFDGTCFLKISAHQLYFMLLAMLIEAYCRLTYLKKEKMCCV